MSRSQFAFSMHFYVPFLLRRLPHAQSHVARRGPLLSLNDATLGAFQLATATDRALIGIHGGTPWRPKGVAAATDPADQFFRGGVHDAFRSGLLPTGDGFRQTVEPCC